MSGGGYPTFKNDRGVPEICIGVKEFMCIGETPPQDQGGHDPLYLLRDAVPLQSWIDTARPSSTGM